MGKARAEIDIDRPADEVWAVVGDFGGIGNWMPGIESCAVDGDDRVLKMGGMEIIERLERRDEEERELVYGIVGGVPVINHKATITVIPEGKQIPCHVGRRRRRRDGRHDAPGLPTEPAGAEGPPGGLRWPIATNSRARHGRRRGQRRSGP